MTTIANSNTSVKTESKTQMLVITALFIALTFVATMFINIRLPLMGPHGLRSHSLSSDAWAWLQDSSVRR